MEIIKTIQSAGIRSGSTTSARLRMERSSIPLVIAVIAPSLSCSRIAGDPFETVIGVGQVIKGWDDGVPRLSLGEKAKLVISPYVTFALRPMESSCS